MTGYTSGYLYRINGVISTDKTVLQNLETLASAAGSFLSYDIHDSRWSVIINRANVSIASFDDSNIIGSISISSTGLSELYNSVKLQFPHIDLKDNLDYVTLTIPDGDRNTNEPDNELNLQYDILNDPVQAQYLAFIELKQNRLDTAITFNTDYSHMNLKAGDIIDVTNDILGYDGQTFRIISISESDESDGSIILTVRALIYDATIYDTTDLYRYLRSEVTGITTQGNIGIPGSPTINKYEVNSRPRILIESTSPVGTVTGMEFWYTSNANVALDQNRQYTLLGTTVPTLGNVFAYGTEVEFEYAGTLANSFYVKTRGINSQTAGPFSNAVATSYTPVQTTDAVGVATQVKDSGGNNILSTLTLSALLSLLNGLFQGNTTVGTQWGNALSTSQAGVSSLTAGSGISLSASTGSVIISAPGSGVTSIIAGNGISISSSTGNVTVSANATSGLWQGAARYVQSTTPSGSLNNGDVWFKIP